MKDLKELMMKIDKFNSQQLNMLVEHIFDISNEDDIFILSISQDDESLGFLY